MLGGVGVRGARVRDLDGEVDDTVAVLGHMPGEEAAPLGGRLDDRGEHKTGRAVRQDVTRGLPAAVLRSGVGDELHTEGRGVVVRGLLGVADGEDDGVHALDREGVGLARGVGGGVGVHRGVSHGLSVPPFHKVRNSSRIHWAICAADRENEGAICTV